MTGATSYTLRRSAIVRKRPPLSRRRRLAAAKECIEEQLNKQFSEADLKKPATHNPAISGGENCGRLDGAAEKTVLDDAIEDLAHDARLDS